MSLLNALVVKHIPVWMPGSEFKRRALRVEALVRRTLDMPYDMVKRALAMFELLSLKYN